MKWWWTERLDIGDVWDGGGTEGLAKVTKRVTIGLTGMGAIYVLNVPGTGRSGGVVWLIEEIGLPSPS